MQLNFKLVASALLLATAPFIASAGSTVADKNYIVTYPSDTPQNVVDQAIQKIIGAGGQLVHEYRLIKGFAVKATAEAVNMVHALDANYHATVEEDKVVSIWKD